MGEFGPQLNLLTELIQENLLHEQVAEVLVDTDDEDEPPGLEPAPDDEPQAMPLTSAAAIPSPLAVWRSHEHVAPLSWTRMCFPFSSEQMSLIHQMGMAHHVNMYPYMRCLTSEVRADLQWQGTF